MYRVIIKPAGKGQFSYRVADSPVQGLSRQPLLDACRQLKQAGADPDMHAALFHAGDYQWTVRTTVGKGAELTVRETDASPLFAKYRQFPDA